MVYTLIIYTYTRGSITLIFLTEFRQIERQVFQFRSREIRSLPQSKPSVSTAPSSEGAEELIFASAYSIEGATGSIVLILRLSSARWKGKRKQPTDDRYQTTENINPNSMKSAIRFQTADVRHQTI